MTEYLKRSKQDYFRRQGYQQGRADALDHCEKCEAEQWNALYKAEMKGRADALDKYKWISVKDKMPNDCGEDWVLVLPYDGDFRCIPAVAEFRKGHWWGHTLCTEDDCIDGADSPFEVRYWKPIYDEFQLEYLEQLKGEQNG